MQKVDITNWKEFVVGDLFEVSRPISRKITDYNEGDFAFIASGAFNNGVQCYVSPKSETDIDKGECITISPLDGYAFYQENDFLGRGGAGSSIIILRNNNLNKYNALFICSLFRKRFSYWSYDNMGNKDIVKEEIIKLPVDKNNKPDWQYMENYIQNMLNMVQSTIYNLQSTIYNLQSTIYNLQSTIYNRIVLFICCGKNFILKIWDCRLLNRLFIIQKMFVLIIMVSIMLFVVNLIME